MKRILWTLSSVMAAVGVCAAVVVGLNLRGEAPLPAAETAGEKIFGLNWRLSRAGL